MALGVMFHHFIDDKHPYIQGALTALEFEKILLEIGPERFLKPEEWVEKSVAGKLSKDDLCLTFDDALLSQVEVALPVLDSLGLKAFFFVYSSIFEGEIEMFEMIRYFRNMRFRTNHDFYDAFYDVLKNAPDWPTMSKKLDSDEAAGYLQNYLFYSQEDRRFRYMRDFLLDSSRYNRICSDMMAARNFDKNKEASLIWMTNDMLKQLVSGGHTIGLHSTTHPTNLGKWDKNAQRSEYEHNFRHLSRILGAPPRTVAYPSGSYNSDTLALMQEMQVLVGFRSEIGTPSASTLEQPRLDYSLYMRPQSP